MSKQAYLDITNETTDRRFLILFDYEDTFREATGITELEKILSERPGACRDCMVRVYEYTGGGTLIHHSIKIKKQPIYTIDI